MERSKVFLNRRQSRMVDEIALRHGIAGIKLMENAGKGCVARLEERGVSSAVICCGIGNNGGDGFVIARRLAVKGVPVKVVVCGPTQKLAGDALTNFQIATSLDLDIIRFDDSMDSRSIEALLRTVDDLATDWIVDALLGTGATGDPKPPYNRIIEAANSVRCRRMAVDIPTGLDCDTGLPGNPTFRADLTCTFVTRKIGFRNPLAQEFLGEVRVISIGVPIEIVEEIVRAENEQAGI